MLIIVICCSISQAKSLSDSCLKFEAKKEASYYKGRCIDFSHSFLRREDLSFNNYAHMKFIKVRVQEGGSFLGSNLSHADFSSSRLEGVHFNHSFLSHSRFENIYGPRSHWNFVTAEGVVFRSARLSQSRFRSANLKKAYFSFADLSFADFRGAFLQGTHFDGAVVIGTQFKEALFDSRTRLPFSKEEALKRGMIEVQSFQGEQE